MLIYTPGGGAVLKLALHQAVSISRSDRIAQWTTTRRMMYIQLKPQLLSPQRWDVWELARRHRRWFFFARTVVASCDLAVRVSSR